MAVRPLGDKVLVKIVDAEEKTKGGIILPDSAKEEKAEGQIVAVGKGRVGDVAKAVADLFRSNSEPTKQEFYDAMIHVVGGKNQHDNIMYYVGMHLAAGVSMMNDRDIVEVVAELAKQPNPEPSEEVMTEEEEEEMAA